MDRTTFQLLRLIHEHQPVTRRALSERTGLGMSRVSALVAQLISAGLVCERATQGHGPGRPASTLGVSPGAGKVVGLDIGGRNSRATLCDLQGDVLASVVQPSEAVADREAILQSITQLVKAVCLQGGTSPGALAGLGAGVQGIVNTQTGVVVDWPNTPSWAPAWAGLDVPRQLANRLGIGLVLVDDSVRAMGLACQRFGQARGTPSFLYVFLGNGIGFAMFVDRLPYRGSSGVAGELGHVTVREDGPSCSCGNRGCLEVMASTSAVLQRVRDRLSDAGPSSILRSASERGALTLEGLFSAARNGDKLAFQVLDETGTYVGKVLAMALNLLGLELVVLGGPLAQDDGIILDAIQRQVRLGALQCISSRTRIVCDDQGELAGARGAALLAIAGLFSSEEKAARLLR
jgi:glucokinase